jgi:hypothetical protein
MNVVDIPTEFIVNFVIFVLFVSILGVSLETTQTSGLRSQCLYNEY